MFVFCYPKFPPDWDVLSLFRQKPAGYHALCILTVFLKQYWFPAFLHESCCLLTHRCCLKAFIHWMHFFFYVQIMCKENISNCLLFLHRMRTSCSRKAMFYFLDQCQFFRTLALWKKKSSTSWDICAKPTSCPSPTMTATMLFVWTSQHWDTNDKNINLKDNLWQSLSLHQHPEICVELVVIQF